MSSLPECKICGNYQHHGEVTCPGCLRSLLFKEREKVLDELETFIGNLQFKYGLLSNQYLNSIKDKIEELREGKKCSECGRPLDSRGKCHECLNNQFLDNEYDAAYGKDGE